MQAGVSLWWLGKKFLEQTHNDVFFVAEGRAGRATTSQNQLIPSVIPALGVANNLRRN
jgi:hypothetical protein